ncbi:branched-chain amino acid ABC transporter permease [Tepidicella baoligensis]|uniref:branched-chain amino acid ABC transporter permease n=1 Tax=Tepidicella baoligensis TaxID=2707016 RepID=UPI0015DAA436|nr:branched-chain amino acid ABC transporter permease [Tepidicella baoligensis]
MTLDHLFFTGLNVLLAWSVYVALLTGSLSFAQGAFMALGCYGAGILTVKFGLPLLPGTLLAAVGAAAIAIVLGYPALRLRGIYLILATLGITYCVRVLLENVDYVGGVAGFGGMTGASLQGVFIAVLLVGALLFWLSRSPLQRVFDAVREDDRVAASMGIQITQIRLMGFAAGAAIAAIAGSLYGHYMSFVRPENFDVLLSVYVVLYVVLGGVNNLWGPLLGATVMTLLPEYFRVLADWRPTVFGLAILLLLLFRPEGLLSFRTRTCRASKAAAS